MAAPAHADAAARRRTAATATAAATAAAAARACRQWVTAMSEADKRSLKVKAGVVKRLRKELDMYSAEVAAETAKVQRLRDAGADPHDIKYQASGPARLQQCCATADMQHCIA